MISRPNQSAKMKTPSKFITFLVTLAVLSSCTSMKRFRSASFRGEDPDLVQVDLFRTTLDTGDPVPDPKNLWDLSASAQTQLIQILNVRYPDNPHFIAALNQRFPGEGKTDMRDLTTADLRLVFTVSKQRDYSELGVRTGRYSPADRIQYLKISLELPADANLHFRDWNRYETEYGELEIGDVSFSRDIELDVQATGEYARGDLSASSGRREDQQVRTRTMRLNGRLSDSRLTVEEEGDRATDLTGNVVADVSLEFDGFPERISVPLVNGYEDGIPLLTGLMFRDLLVPRMENAPGTLTGKLEAEYIYRHVEAGWKTFPEWDDRVSFYGGKVEKEVTILNKSDYTPEIYGIGMDPQQTGSSGQILRIRSAGGEEFPLRFLGLAEARCFYEWLEGVTGKNEGGPGAPVKIGPDMLLFLDGPLTSRILSENPGLKVFPVY
jgi:hypothetical protein